MSDQHQVFTLDCTDRLLELCTSTSPDNILGNSIYGSELGKFVQERQYQMIKKISAALPNCTVFFSLLQDPFSDKFKPIEVNRHKCRKIEFEVKAPLDPQTIPGKATSIYVTIGKRYLTDTMKNHYQTSDSITYNNVTYTSPNKYPNPYYDKVYILIKEGQSISLTISQIDPSEVYLAITPGDRPAYLITSSLIYCPDYKKCFVTRRKLLMGSAEAIDNVSLEDAQKMFGIIPTNQKTGMLESSKPQGLKQKYLPTQSTSDSIISTGQR